METDLVSNLLDFLREKRIEMELWKTSDSEFWLESPDGFMTVDSLQTRHRIPTQHICASGLSIKPKTRVSKIDALKEIIRVWGMKPEEILAKEARHSLTAPMQHQPERRRPNQNPAQALKETIRKELHTQRV